MISDEASGADDTNVKITETARRRSWSTRAWRATPRSSSPAWLPKAITYRADAAGDFRGGITYWTGSGADTIAIDGTHLRAGVRTVTSLNTGLGNDNVTVDLDTPGDDDFFVLNTQGQAQHRLSVPLSVGRPPHARRRRERQRRRDRPDDDSVHGQPGAQRDRPARPAAVRRDGLGHRPALRRAVLRRRRRRNGPRARVLQPGRRRHGGRVRERRDGAAVRARLAVDAGRAAGRPDHEDEHAELPAAADRRLRRRHRRRQGLDAAARHLRRPGQTTSSTAARPATSSSATAAASSTSTRR